MNLVQGELQVDGEAAVTVGTQRITLDAKVIDGALRRGYAGRRLVVGLRLEDMEDAPLLADSPPDRRLAPRRPSSRLSVPSSSSTSDRRAWSSPADTKELAADRILDNLDQSAGAGRPRWWRSPRSDASNDDPIELAVDTAALHFFDIDSGLAIRD